MKLTGLKGANLEPPDFSSGRGTRQQAEVADNHVRPGHLLLGDRIRPRDRLLHQPGDQAGPHLSSQDLNDVLSFDGRGPEDQGPYQRSSNGRRPLSLGRPKPPKGLLEVVQCQRFLEEGLLFLIGEKLFGDFAQIAMPQIGLRDLFASGSGYFLDCVEQSRISDLSLVPASSL